MHQHDVASIVVTHSRYYGLSQPNLVKEPAPPKIPLQIDQLKVVLCIPKGVLKCSGHDPNSQATEHYSIVKDLGQTPCAMSALEVLQTCLS